jgi:ABC-type polysaccharide/polyol phosphate export permease
MQRRNATENRAPLFDAKGLLGFRPWMLALAVFLACAIGVALMEQFRDTATMWAQAAADAPGGR